MRAAGPGVSGGRTLGSSFSRVKQDRAHENPFPFRVLVAYARAHSSTAHRGAIDVKRDALASVAERKTADEGVMGWRRQ